MRILSTDPEEPGIFAVGQAARGIFALGQLSLGVVAIGQLAGGVIAIGQGAGGLVAIGQGAYGVLWAGGMVGVGGRGFGMVLTMLPKLVVQRFERPTIPPVHPWAAFRDGMDRGWMLARVEPERLAFEGAVDGERPALELSEEAAKQLAHARAEGHSHVCLTVVVEERVKAEEAGYREAVERTRVGVVPRLKSWLEAPPRVKLEGPLTSPFGLALRLIGFALLVAGWWAIPGRMIWEMLTG